MLVWSNQLCPIRRDKHLPSDLHVNIPILPGGSFAPEPYWEEIGMKSIISPHRMYLSVLFPCLSQNPACCKAKVSLSWSSSSGGKVPLLHLGSSYADQRFRHHTNKISPHPFQSREVQIWPQLSTFMFFQMADYLSHYLTSHSITFSDKKNQKQFGQKSLTN